MKTTYLGYLLVWMLPVVLAQWWIAGCVLRRNLKAVLLPALIVGAYLSCADAVAIRAGIWFFDPKQNLGILLFGLLPVEETLFFFLTSLLVAQSLVMFLPDTLRTPSLP